LNKYEKQIKEYQSLFRILEGMKIFYNPKSERKGMCSYSRVGSLIRWAEIYAPGKIKDHDYIFHEILHIAVNEAKYKNQQELLVQDICNIVNVLGLKLLNH
jgi:hypothetical protein